MIKDLLVSWQPIFWRFNAEGIEIPDSKQDIYIKEMPQLQRE